MHSAENLDAQLLTLRCLQVNKGFGLVLYLTDYCHHCTGVGRQVVGLGRILDWMPPSAQPVVDFQYTFLDWIPASI